jgi:predicted GIY-YIG superfamily endonuclease
MVLIEPQADRLSAMRRERAIKAMGRSRKLRLIEAVGKRHARRRRPANKVRR